ncbi:MAG: hypothetical protein AB8H12_08155 [Lewinella sp.]
MNAFLKLSSCFLIVCLALLSSCEKESLSPTTETTDFTPVSFEEAVIINDDGSYSYELTGAQMLSLLSQETSNEILPTDGNELSDAFGRMVMEKQNTKGNNQDKMITYSLRYRVETILSPGDPISSWIITGGGTGGLIPNVTPSVSFQTTQTRSFGSFFLMFATVDANDSSGNGIFSDSDSSFDITSCTSTKFNIRRIVGKAKINWNTNATFSGDADVACRSIQFEAEPLPLEPSFE